MYHKKPSFYSGLSSSSSEEIPISKSEDAQFISSGEGDVHRKHSPGTRGRYLALHGSILIVNVMAFLLAWPKVLPEFNGKPAESRVSGTLNG